MYKFNYDFTKVFSKDALVTVRFSMRLKSCEDRLTISVITGTPADLNAYCDRLVKDDDVLSAGCEYLSTIEADKLFMVYSIKAKERPVEEVD